jgi:hypothetical protein
MLSSPTRCRDWLASWEQTPEIATSRPFVVRVTDAPSLDPTELALALRTLARLLVRRHRQEGDCRPNVPRKERSSPLTVVRDPSPHEEDEIG